MNNLLPGQHRLRAPRTQTARRTSQDIGPVLIAVTRSGVPVPVPMRLDPASAGAGADLARHFANEWAARFDRNGRWHSAERDRVILRRFFDVLNQAGATSWEDVTVAFLIDVERTFDRTHYYPSIVWEVLRRLPGGTLAPDVTTFLQSPPNVTNALLKPTEAMPTHMLREVLRQAMRDVTRAEERLRRVALDPTASPRAEDFLQRHETTAYYILLCMEWAQSPDVIADLSFDPSRPTSVQDWHDGKPKVSVQWYKNRGGANGTHLMLADKPWRAGSILRRLRDATEPMREHLSGDWANSPWVFARTITPENFPKAEHNKQRVQAFDGTTGFIIDSIHNDSPDRGLRWWCDYVRDDGRQVRIDDVYQGSRVQLPYRSIRPAAKWARFVATGGGLLLSELVDDNTIEVLSAHYLNSDVAMRDIGEAWNQIPSLAEEVARGLRPTVVDRDGTVLSGPGIDDEERQRALGGNHVGTSGCRNPLDSPLTGERAGSLCGQANRSCFACPNSVVSPDDIPSLTAYLVLAERAHGHLSPPEWELHWGLTVRWIRYVLPLLDPQWESLPVGPTAMFDLGLEAGPA